MQLSRVFLDNYRGFTNFETRFEGFTAIVGRNSVGKTSLVHALELLFHIGGDSTIPVTRDDFHRQEDPLVMEAIFSDLDDIDTQAFFNLKGTPDVDQVGVRLEAQWEAGEIIAERHLIRPDKQGEERKITRYTHRYGQFISFAYISPYRDPEQSTRFTRDSDYRRVVSAYAGDYLQPIESLHASVVMLHREIQTTVAERGGLEAEEYETANSCLGEILDFVDSYLVTGSLDDAPHDFRDRIASFNDTWEETHAHCLSVLESEVSKGDSSITDEIRKKYTELGDRTSKLLHRCQVQSMLLELRDSVLSRDDFDRMRQSLSSVLGLLLPEVPPTLQPFPIQDDRLLSDVLVQLGGTEFAHSGSGYQSTFSIGLKITGATKFVTRPTRFAGADDHYHPLLEHTLGAFI